MTPFVLFIAALHAIPVLVVAVWTRNRGATIVAALISGTVGVLTGSSRYTAIDLAAVAIAYVCSLVFIKNSASSRAPTSLPLPERRPTKSPSFGWWIVPVAAVLVLFMIANLQPSDPSPSGQAPPGAANRDHGSAPEIQRRESESPTYPPQTGLTYVPAPPAPPAKTTHPQSGPCITQEKRSARQTCGGSSSEALQDAYYGLRQSLIDRGRYDSQQIERNDALAASLSACPNNACYREKLLGAIDDLRSHPALNDGHP